MNFLKIEFITYIYILYYQSSINLQLSPNLTGFPDILNEIRHNVGFGIAKNAKFPRLTSWRYVFTQTSVNKQRYWMDLTLAHSNACMCVWLKSIVHEGMNHISNVEVHLKIRSGNVNIRVVTFKN